MAWLVPQYQRVGSGDLLNCIREVPGSHLTRDNDYFHFCGLPHTFEANSEAKQGNWPRTLPSKSFAIQHLLFIIKFDAVYPELDG